MRWVGTVEHYGEVIYHSEGTVQDVFEQMALARDDTDSEASISATVSHSLPYGEVKVSFTVTVKVPQTKPAMDYAAEHAFATAVSYVNAGMHHVASGAPLLPQPQPQARHI